jgi:hypothetical protein
MRKCVPQIGRKGDVGIERVQLGDERRGRAFEGCVVTAFLVATSGRADPKRDCGRLGRVSRFESQERDGGIAHGRAGEG